MIKDLYMDEVESNPRDRPHIVRSPCPWMRGRRVFVSRFRRTGTRGPPSTPFSCGERVCIRRVFDVSDSWRSSRDPAVKPCGGGPFDSGGIGFLVAAGYRQGYRGDAAQDERPFRVVLSVTAVLLLAGTAFFFAAERDGRSGTFPGREVWPRCSRPRPPRTAGFDTVPRSALGDRPYSWSCF
jgi:hypothetical protein